MATAPKAFSEAKLVRTLRYDPYRNRAHDGIFAPSGSGRYGFLDAACLASSVLIIGSAKRSAK
jgi:hypothetical protein